MGWCTRRFLLSLAALMSHSVIFLNVPWIRKLSESSHLLAGITLFGGMLVLILLPCALWGWIETDDSVPAGTAWKDRRPGDGSLDDDTFFMTAPLWFLLPDFLPWVVGILVHFLVEKTTQDTIVEFTARIVLWYHGLLAIFVLLFWTDPRPARVRRDLAWQERRERREEKGCLRQADLIPVVPLAPPMPVQQSLKETLRDLFARRQQEIDEVLQSGREQNVVEAELQRINDEYEQLIEQA